MYSHDAPDFNLYVLKVFFCQIDVLLLLLLLCKVLKKLIESLLLKNSLYRIPYLMFSLKTEKNHIKRVFFHDSKQILLNNNNNKNRKLDLDI